eukprot:scaffold173785_cov51-Attheya_sp.AAC.3
MDSQQMMPVDDGEMPPSTSYLCLIKQHNVHFWTETDELITELSWETDPSEKNNYDVPPKTDDGNIDYDISLVISSEHEGMRKKLDKMEDPSEEHIDVVPPKANDGNIDNAIGPILGHIQ